MADVLVVRVTNRTNHLIKCVSRFVLGQGASTLRERTLLRVAGCGGSHFVADAGAGGAHSATTEKEAKQIATFHQLEYKHDVINRFQVLNSNKVCKKQK